MKKHPKHRLKIATVGACLSMAMVGIASAQAQSPAPSGDGKLDKLEKENQDLRKRLEVLESLAQKEGLLQKADAAAGSSIKALTESTLSGFVTASYFHDTANPPGGISPGYLWNRKNDSLSLNKFKVTLASPPAEMSGDKWDAAYRGSLIFGQDAPIVNSSAATIGFQNLREAYLEINVPVGTGLKVSAGEMISLLNYESGDGGAANDNFSQGYQWFYTGNGPAASIQLAYKLTDWLDVKARLQNGLFAGPVDNNRSKTGVIAFGIKPNDKMWFSLIGFAGRESFAAAGTPSFFVSGGSLLGGYQIDEKWHVGTELDYFNFSQAVAATGPGIKDNEVYSAGLWLSYALSEKVTPALRAEFISDKNGVDLSGDPLGFVANTGQDIVSIALTLNYKPTANIKIQPEIRYDHSSLKGAFGGANSGLGGTTAVAGTGKASRVVFGVGASYLF